MSKYLLVLVIWTLTSAAEPLKEEASSFIHIWVALEGKIATAHEPLPDQKATEAATDSYNDRLSEFLRSWRTTVLGPFATKVTISSTEIKEYHSGLVSLIDRPEPDEALRRFDGIGFSNLGTVFGYQFVSWQRIALNITGENKISFSGNQVVSGEPQFFFAAPKAIHRETDVSWTVEQITDAFQKSQESFWKRCEDWKTRVASQFGDALVFASCGVPTLRVEYQGPHYTKRTVTYSSDTATIYYTP